MTRALLLLLCVVGAARAQEEESPVVTARPQFTAPTLRKKVSAPYPPEALKDGLSGTVQLDLELDEKGQVTNVIVTHPAGHGFDEAAVAAVKQFEFTPALSDRQPIPSRVTYAYRVVLTQPSPSPRPEAPVRFKGGVFLRGTRSPVVDGTVIAVDKEGTPSKSSIDEKGHFEIKCPPGRVHVVIVGPRANRYEHDETIGEKETLTVNYFIDPSQYTRYESTVRADVNREEISRVQLTTEELLKIPGTGGDALRAIENLPGAARAPFNSGLIIVRGG